MDDSLFGGGGENEFSNFQSSPPMLHLLLSFLDDVDTLAPRSYMLILY